MSAEAEGPGCRSNRHCVDFGFCHRCGPELSEQVLARWFTHGREGDSEAYEEIVGEVKDKFVKWAAVKKKMGLS